VASSTKKLEHVKALGAFGVIDTRANPDWSAAALDLTDGRGVDHVLELIGGDNISRSAVALTSGGRIAQIGFMKGSEIVLSAVPMMLKRAIIQGISGGHRRVFEVMNRVIDEHGIKPVIDKVYAFEDARAAFGKVVVRFKSEVGS
jgi:NADPH:quinone reductase-like Zn-dependent oxidoreductase